jgi:iron(III) transport system substrate-binding protein
MGGRGAKRRASGAVIAAALACVLAPCAGRAQSAEPDILTYKGPDRARRLLEGAAKEGEVVLYSGLIVNQALRPLTTAFQKKYPSIKMTYWRADSEDIAVKLSSEMRGGNLVADVVEGTGIGEMVIRAGRLVAADKVPKTYEDLLDPQWTGKMAWPPHASSGAPLFVTNLRVAWGEDKALAYLRKLAGQHIVNFGAGSARTLVDRVIAGEYPIALAIYAHHPLISAGKGAPVNSRLLEPVPSAAGTMVVPKGARHPHAALLLLDFVLSKEGQEIMSRAEYFPVRPDVEPLAHLASIVPEHAGVVENFIGPEDLNKYTEKSANILEELFR